MRDVGWRLEKPSGICDTSIASSLKVSRGCTLGGYEIVKFVKDRKSVILGVWAAPEAQETLPKGGG